MTQKQHVFNSNKLTTFQLQINLLQNLNSNSSQEQGISQGSILSNLLLVMGTSSVVWVCLKCPPGGGPRKLIGRDSLARNLGCAIEYVRAFNLFVSICFGVLLAPYLGSSRCAGATRCRGTAGPIYTPIGYRSQALTPHRPP